MARDDLMSMIGRPIGYEASAEVVCDTFIYAETSDALFLHVWYDEEGRVSEISDRHQNVCGFYDPEIVE